MGVQLTQEMIQGAIQTQNMYGVPASVTLAQILLESGGSNPGGLSGLAYKYNNLFGIKAGSNWQGQVVNMTTGETINGQNVTIKDGFRVYDSVMDSIIDHGKLLASPFYTKHTGSAKSADEYARAIHKAGYATDPSYSDKLIQIMRQNNFYQYDTGKIGGVTVNPATPSGDSSGTVTGSNTGVSMGFNSNLLEPVFTLIVVGLVLILGALFLAGAFIGSPTEAVSKTVKKVKGKG